MPLNLPFPPTGTKLDVSDHQDVVAKVFGERRRFTTATFRAVLECAARVGAAKGLALAAFKALNDAGKNKAEVGELERLFGAFELAAGRYVDTRDRTLERLRAMANDIDRTLPTQQAAPKASPRGLAWLGEVVGGYRELMGLHCEEKVGYAALTDFAFGTDFESKGNARSIGNVRGRGNAKDCAVAVRHRNSVLAAHTRLLFGDSRANMLAFVADPNTKRILKVQCGLVA